MPRFQDVDNKWFTKPTCNETPLAISHPWLTVNHPDDDHSSQLKMLKAKLRRHKIPDHTPVFFDYLCIPQKNMSQRLCAIDSLGASPRCAPVAIPRRRPSPLPSASPATPLTVRRHFTRCASQGSSRPSVSTL